MLCLPSFYFLSPTCRLTLRCKHLCLNGEPRLVPYRSGLLPFGGWGGGGGVEGGLGGGVSLGGVVSTRFVRIAELNQSCCHSLTSAPVCLSVCLSVCVSVCLSVSVSVSVCLSVCLSVSLSLSLSLSNMGSKATENAKAMSLAFALLDVQHAGVRRRA